MAAVHARTDSVKRAAAAFTGMALLLGAVEAWISRFDMYSDGISYLNISDAMLRGDWHAAVNAYWSPLYPAFLAAALRVLNPDSYWEFPVVHLVNFLIYGFGLVCFRYFLSGAISADRSRSGASIWIWHALGYTLFIWSSLRLVEISTVSPDMLVAAFVYLAAGAFHRIVSGGATFQRFIVLGIALGLGFLAKAPILPLSMVFLVLTFFAVPNHRQALTGIMLSLVAILVIVGPFVIGLSKAQGKVTTGESWRLNAAWYINQVPRYHWQGDIAGLGKPVHPTRTLATNPPLYEFDAPVGGTYAVWLDPAYWFSGIQPHLSPKSMVRQAIGNGLGYYDLFFRLQPAVLVVWLTLYLANSAQRSALSKIGGYWPLLLIAVAAFSMYAVVHVENRMIGAFFVILWVSLFASLRIEPDKWLLFGRYAVSALVLMIMITLTASMGGRLASHSPRELLSWYRPASHFQWQIAEELRSHGFQAGDKVAWLRPNPFTAKQNYWWARLARLRIIAEVPAGQEDRFWAADASSRTSFFQALETTDAKALIATRLPVGYPAEGWKPLGQTGYYFYPLSR